VKAWYNMQNIKHFLGLVFVNIERVLSILSKIENRVSRFWWWWTTGSCPPVCCCL